MGQSVWPNAVYKGMLSGRQLRISIPIFRARIWKALWLYAFPFSTNTFPSWERPSSLLPVHNGEINTLRGM